jgi:uncharacterized Ntn-hydrolase superfamily protein
VTFSLAGRCGRTGAFGVAIASSSPAVAARCAHVRAGVGAATTQNVTDPRLGPALLDALSGGASAGEAVATVSRAAPFAAHRQLSCVDTQGRAAAWSGDLALGRHGHGTGEQVAAAGNLLAADDVVPAMVAAFEADPGRDLSDRLLLALETAWAAGGEAGPVRSAGLLVVEDVPWATTDLRVDWHDDPISELRRLWQVWQPQARDYVTRALDPTDAPSYGVPGDV